MPEFIKALQAEVIQKKNLLNEPITSIYFGGGTPSKLSTADLRSILDTISKHYSIKPDAEINIEVNPEDLTDDYAASLKSMGFNRISIGIQSFQEEDLKMMNRAHNREQALHALDILQKTSFQKISADLMYGLPRATNEQLIENIQTIHQFGIEHLSCYSLTVEEKTKLKRLIDRGSIDMIPENGNILHYEALIETTQVLGYEQYEISNFAQHQKYAQHNTAYWFGESYLGFGPGAHSFYNQKRTWNISNLNQYIKGVLEHEAYEEEEDLTAENKTNEYIMTSLRTKWGMDLNKLNQWLSYPNHKEITSLIQDGYLATNPDGNIVLTHEGKMIADHIIMQLMV